MISLFFIIFFNIFPQLKGKILKQWYELLAKFYQRNDWRFMNFGYAELNGKKENLFLEKAD
jgi:hypothetical protein